MNLGHSELKVLLRHMLSSLTERVHAYDNVNKSADTWITKNTSLLLYRYLGPQHRSTDPSSQLALGD